MESHLGLQAYSPSRQGNGRQTRRAERIGYDLWGGVTQNNRTYLFIRSIMHVDRNISFFIRRGAILMNDILYLQRYLTVFAYVASWLLLSIISFELFASEKPDRIFFGFGSTTSRLGMASKVTSEPKRQILILWQQRESFSSALMLPIPYAVPAGPR